MNKKIGDYTLKEMKKICDSRFKKGHPYCTKCRFYNVCMLSPDEMAQEDLDKEIEVEIDE